MKYSIVETFLRSRNFILCLAIFSVLWLTPNTYWVYFSMMKGFSPGWRELVSGGMALIVSSGILIYTMRGNMKIANYYMWFEISISTFYYCITIGWSWWLIPAFSFVFMLPVSLKHYTAELNKDEEKDKVEQDLSWELSAIKIDEAKNNIIIQNMAAKITEQNEIISDLHQTIKTKPTVEVEAEKVIVEKNNLGNMSEDQLISLMKNNSNYIPPNLF